MSDLFDFFGDMSAPSYTDVYDWTSNTVPSGYADMAGGYDYSSLGDMSNYDWGLNSPVSGYTDVYDWSANNVPVGYTPYEVTDWTYDDATPKMSYAELQQSPYAQMFSGEYQNPAMFNAYLATTPEAPGIMDYLSSGWDSIGRGADSMEGALNKYKNLLSLGGAGVSMLDARKRNKLAKSARAKQDAEKAALKAEQTRLGAVQPRTNLKTAITDRDRIAAAAARGQGEWFDRNSLRDVVLAADGGHIQGYEDEEYARFASGGYLNGGTAGQADQIPALLSDGEFVVDADTVSALGDGNNAAGASVLETMRRNVRKHKRSAPVDKIPPKAKKPEAYMKGKK